jgi:hypothetical protein
MLLHVYYTVYRFSSDQEMLCFCGVR